MSHHDRVWYNMKCYAYILAHVNKNMLCTGQGGYIIIILNTCTVEPRLTADLPTLTQSDLWDWSYKPVRKPVRNLRRMFHGTITQISIMKTLTKHQIAGNKSFIFFMVCDTVCYRAMSIRQKLALLEFTRFHYKTVVVVCFFRLFSAVLNKSRHWVKKLHPNVCSIRLVNNKTKKRSLTLQCLLYGIFLVVANLVTRWKHSNA